MTTPLSRRHLLRVLAAAGLAASPLARASSGRAAGDLRFGRPQAFSFERLVAEAQAMAGRPYAQPPRPNPEIVARIDYDAYGKIRNKPENALWNDGPGVYPITLKHVGMFFPKSVRMHVVEDGTAREILYHEDYFDMPPDHVAHGLPDEPSAFAGFWIQESRLRGDWTEHEPWATFLGASYFRAVGELGQVGQSARGIAIGSGDPGPEEFPDFIGHWFIPALHEGDPVVVCSLLDGPSIAGAYRFEIRRTEGVVMEIDARLFPRREVPRLGIAPLTSMFWFGEYGRRRYEDWRPEVHDADGLAIWNGAGERLWRPLNNPPRIVTSSFFDINPRGFGLTQRDRDYDHYLDGVRYHLRPTTWVEPLGEWGRGSVQLVEIPTDDEIYDNIVAFWVPETPPKGGDRLAYRYRLHWLADEPFASPDLARAFAMGMGKGGQPGQARPKGVYKLMVDFAGGPLDELPEGVEPEPEISSSVGTISRIHMERTPFTKRWRVTFDLDAPPGSVAELRLLYRLDGKPITETWLYQFHVPAPAA
jgi:glucans biosynthesis protein